MIICIQYILLLIFLQNGFIIIQMNQSGKDLTESLLAASLTKSLVKKLESGDTVVDQISEENKSEQMEERPNEENGETVRKAEKDKGFKSIHRSEICFGDLIFLEGIFNEQMEKGVLISQDSDSLKIYGPDLSNPLNSQTCFSEGLFRVEKEGLASQWQGKRLYAYDEMLLCHVSSNLYLQMDDEQLDIDAGGLKCSLAQKQSRGLIWKLENFDQKGCSHVVCARQRIQLYQSLPSLGTHYLSFDQESCYPHRLVCRLENPLPLKIKIFKSKVNSQISQNTEEVKINQISSNTLQCLQVIRLKCVSNGQFLTQQDNYCLFSHGKQAAQLFEVQTIDLPQDTHDIEVSQLIRLKNIVSQKFLTTNQNGDLVDTLLANDPNAYFGIKRKSLVQNNQMSVQLNRPIQLVTPDGDSLVCPVHEMSPAHFSCKYELSQAIIHVVDTTPAELSEAYTVKIIYSLMSQDEQIVKQQQQQQQKAANPQSSQKNQNILVCPRHQLISVYLNNLIKTPFSQYSLSQLQITFHSNLLPFLCNLLSSIELNHPLSSILHETLLFLVTDSRPNCEYLLNHFHRQLEYLSPTLLQESFSSAYWIGPRQVQLVQNYCQDLKILREDTYQSNYASQTQLLILLKSAMLGKPKLSSSKQKSFVPIAKPNPFYQTQLMLYLKQHPTIKIFQHESIQLPYIMFWTNSDKIGFLETNQILSDLLQQQNVEAVRKQDHNRTKCQAQWHFDQEFAYLDLNLLFSGQFYGLQNYVLAFLQMIGALSYKARPKVSQVITESLCIDHLLLVNIAIDRRKSDRLRECCMQIFDNLFLAFRGCQSYKSFLNNDIFLCFTKQELKNQVVEDVLQEYKEIYIKFVNDQWMGKFQIKRNIVMQMQLFIQIIKSTTNLITCKHLSEGMIHEITKGIKQCLIGMDLTLFESHDQQILVKECNKNSILARQGKIMAGKAPNFVQLSVFFNKFKKERRIYSNKKFYDQIYQSVFDQLINLQNVIQENLYERQLLALVSLYQQNYSVFTNYQEHHKLTQQFWSSLAYIQPAKIKNLRLFIDVVIWQKESDLLQSSKTNIIRMMNDFLCQRNIIFNQIKKVCFVFCLEDFQALLQVKQHLKKRASLKNVKKNKSQKVGMSLDQANQLFQKYRKEKDFQRAFQLQEMCRNLELHLRVIKVLLEENVQQQATQFLTHFCHSHSTNQSELLPHFKRILEVQCDSKQLILQILQNNQDIVYLQIMMELYEKQRHQLEQRSQLTHILRKYVLMNIQGKTLEDKDQYIKLILNSLLKNYKDSKFPLRLKNMMEQGKESPRLLKILLDDMGLLGQIAKASILGKAQVRKIVVVDELMSILISPKEQFMVKRAILKLISGLIDYSHGRLEFLEAHDLETIYRQVVLEDLRLVEKYQVGLIDRQHGRLRSVLNQQLTRNVLNTQKDNEEKKRKWFRNNTGDPRILEDIDEYWHYLSDSSSGLLHFLLETQHLIQNPEVKMSLQISPNFVDLQKDITRQLTRIQQFLQLVKSEENHQFVERYSFWVYKAIQMSNIDMSQLTGKRLALDQHMTNINSIYTEHLVHMTDSNPSSENQNYQTILNNPIEYISALHRLSLQDWSYLLRLEAHTFRHRDELFPLLKQTLLSFEAGNVIPYNHGYGSSIGYSLQSGNNQLNDSLVNYAPNAQIQNSPSFKKYGELPLSPKNNNVPSFPSLIDTFLEFLARNYVDEKGRVHLTLFFQYLRRIFMVSAECSEESVLREEEYYLAHNKPVFLEIFESKWVIDWQNQQISELVAYLQQSPLGPTVKSLLDFQATTKDTSREINDKDKEYEANDLKQNLNLQETSFTFRILGQIVDQNIPQFLLNDCGIHKIQDFHAFYVAYQPGTVFTEKNFEILGEFRRIQNTMVEAGALEFAMEVLKRADSPGQILEVVMLLTRLLFSGNRGTQEHFYNLLMKDHLASRHFLSYLKWLFNYQLEEEFSLERNRHIDITLNLLELMCENSFTNFQNYLHSQAIPGASIDTSVNILEEMSAFLMTIDNRMLSRIESGESKIALNQENLAEIYGMRQSILSAFEEFCQGMAHGCMQQLSTNRLLLRYLMKCILTDINPLQPQYELDCIAGCVMFLLSVVQDNENQNNEISTLIMELDISHLMHLLHQVYELYKPKGNEEPDKNIQIGFDLFIFISQLQALQPFHPKLSSFSTQVDISKDDTRFSHLKNLTHRNKQETKEYKQLQEQHRINGAMIFYRKFVGIVEAVGPTEQLHKIYFQKPFIMNYLDRYITKDIVYKTVRNSDEERIEHFSNRIKLYKRIMEYRRKIDRIPGLLRLCRNYPNMKIFTFFLLLFSNVLMLLAVKIYRNSDDHNQAIYQMYFVSIQLIIFMSCFNYVVSVIITFPISTFVILDGETYVNHDKRKNFMKATAGYAKKQSFMQPVKWLHNWANKKQIRYLPKFLRDLLQVFFYKGNLYNLFFLTMVYLREQYWALMGVLLVIELFNNSQDLSNIWLGLVKNLMIFLKTFILGIICIYLYAIIGFYSFSQYFVAQEYSQIQGDRLLYTFTSTLNFGMRKGGGIGEVLAQPIKSDGAIYYYMIVYQILFYLFINQFFLQILFGIIIDAFSSLRETEEESQRLVLSQCFICGIDSKVFDQQGRGWLEHIYLDHNVYNYLAFIVYLSNKNLNDCNTIEAHVKKEIQKKSIAWYPIQKAMDIHEDEDQ